MSEGGSGSCDKELKASIPRSTLNAKAAWSNTFVLLFLRMAFLMGFEGGLAEGPGLAGDLVLGSPEFVNRLGSIVSIEFPILAGGP